MPLRFHELAESDHEIPNSIGGDRFETLEQTCRLDRSTSFPDDTGERSAMEDRLREGPEGVSIGDGAKIELILAMRRHANFV